MKVITIGRSSQNDITVNDSKVSRHHCQIIQHDDGNFSLSDFGSTNGTYVNGNRVHGEVKLNPSDVVRIGNTTLQWRNYFKNVSSNGSSNSRVPQLDYTSTPINGRESTTSDSKSSVFPVVLSILGVIVLAAILIIAIVHKADRPNKNSNADPWHYENGARTNFPGASANRNNSGTKGTDNSSSVNYENAQASGNREYTGEALTSGSTGDKQYNHRRRIKPSPAGFSDVDVMGTWVWRSGDDYFELNLSRSEEGRIVGGYCAVWGDRFMDCDEENAIEENRTRGDIIENTVQIRFWSAAWDGGGTALILKLSDDKIQWKLRDTEGESRVPNDVVLLRK